MPKKRKRKEKTEFIKNRDAYRKVSPRHVIVLEAEAPEQLKRELFGYNERLRILGNSLTGELKKRLDQLFRKKAYRSLKTDYRHLSEKMGKVDPEGKRYAELERQRDDVGDRMSAMQKEAGITWDDVRKLMIQLNRKLGDRSVNSIFALARAEDIWRGVEKVLYEDGKTLHFRKRGDLPIIRAKQIEKGITIHIDKDGGPAFHIARKELRIKPVGDDLFLKDELSCLMEYLADPETIEHHAVDLYSKSKSVVGTFRPCFAAIKCVTIRGRLRIFLHITVEADPCPKKDKDGKPRHIMAKGRVGVDIGTQSYAAASPDGRCVLDNLAERNGHSSLGMEHKLYLLQRKMDRSRRAMNPDRYEEDGTIKKGIRKPWKKSKAYRRMEKKLREMQRVAALDRQYAIQEDVWSLRAMGDDLITEQISVSGWKKKAKKPSDGSVAKDKNGRNKRRKRFGHSIQHRCPGYFKAYCEKVFSSTGGRYSEVAIKFRASQYDHIKDAYTKKSLSQRWHELPGKKKVQRDLYSAFLLSCSDDGLERPDKTRCDASFNKFYRSHQQLVSDIKERGLRICNSGIGQSA